MTVWTRLKEELDRAGRVAQVAIDEGKVRLELLRTRQHAYRAAQAIGYAVYRAKSAEQELDAEAYGRLSATLAAHEAEIARLEEQLRHIRKTPAAAPPADAPAEPAAESAAEPAAGSAAAQ